MAPFERGRHKLKRYRVKGRGQHKYNAWCKHTDSLADGGKNICPDCDSLYWKPFKENS